LSTDAELNALSDTLPAIVEILEAPGCTQQDPTPVQQDNSSTLIVSERGYVISRKTQHLATRAAFIKDKTLKYTPTDHMIADILTKAVTGLRLHCSPLNSLDI
jgi:hypothetical protein